MKAILVSKENAAAILEADKSINEFNIPQLLDEAKDAPPYFIPEWDEADNPSGYTGWALIPQEMFYNTFKFDKEAIKTSYVDIERKHFSHMPFAIEITRRTKDIVLAIKPELRALDYERELNGEFLVFDYPTLGESSVVKMIEFHENFERIKSNGYALPVRRFVRK